MAAAILPYMATAFLLISLNFFLPRALPGNPIQALQDKSTLVDPAVRQEQIAYYGLDRPLLEQFGQYLAELAHGDLGTSIRYNAPVLDVIAARLPWTLLLVSTGLALSSLAGIAGGIHSAWRRGRRADRALLTGYLGLQNVPSFVLAYLLLFLFAVTLGWLPLSGGETPFVDLSLPARALDILDHLVLPAATLALSLVGGKYLLMRNTMLAELGRSYMLLGRAKGLSRRTLKYRHAARNALLPVVTLIGNEFGIMITAAIFIETIFSYPGIGRLSTESLAQRDYPLIAGVFLVFSLIVLGANLAVDLLYLRLDPRTATAR